MLEAITFGKPDTGMKGFQGILSNKEIALVADFIRKEFIHSKAPNTRYHTRENGWPNHERYRAAFPFATGEIPIDSQWDTLDKEQQRGLRVFMNTCVSCHDRAKVQNEGQHWLPRPVSYPRNGYDHRTQRPDALTEASIYGKHDIPPKLPKLSAVASEGKKLFELNCAFCHGASGTGKNWIGSFLEPRPRNLTDKTEMQGMTKERLTLAIKNGVANTKMPAWSSVLTEREINALVEYINIAFYPMKH